jgi:hypothetical protein
VYFLSYQASDDESRWMAQLEGVAEPRSGSTPGSDLALILWDMAQAEHLEESSALASRIQEELAVVTGSEGRGVKQAPFRVLVGAAMPAVLIEVVHQQPRGGEAAELEAYQAKIAASLARGIERFRRERSACRGRRGVSPGRAVTPRQANAITVLGLGGLLATVALTAPRWSALLRSPAGSVEAEEPTLDETPGAAPEEAASGRRISVRL